MKSGEIASALGVTPDTIKNWAKHPTLEQFFSAGAKGEDGNFQRTFTEADVLVLSTIHYLRTNGTSDWEQIARRLEGGERHQEFPQNAIAADPRTVPIQQAEQSARAMATLAERDAAMQRVRELETEVDRLRAERETDRSRYEAEAGKLHDQIARLNREIGRLEGRIESLDKD